jgi:hypothetical protein
MLINTSRGAIVDTTAVIDGFKRGAMGSPGRGTDALKAIAETTTVNTDVFANTGKPVYEVTEAT